MEPWQMSAVRAASMVRGGELSAAEVAESVLSRISAVNPALNAIVQRADDDARACAAAVDADSPGGPLAGATFTSKINTDHVPYPTTNGIKALRDNIATVTHPVVRGLLDAGMSMVGRTNSPAFAMRFHTENELHGETLNPHRRDISCGGSSGGAGAAVATGMCHIGQGNDVAGSVRWPAYMNGVIGLRPTIGRMPSGGTNPNPRGWSASMMSTQGPIARTMADIRAGYDAMSAENWADPFWVPARREFPVPAKVRVALVIDDGLGVDDVVKENLRRVGRLMEDAGYEVVETLPPMLETFFSLWKRVGVLDMVLGLVRMLPQIDDAGLTTAMTNWTNTFPEATGETFLKALQDRDMLIRAWNAFFAEHQLLVTPMMTKPTIPRAYDISHPDASAELDDYGRWGVNLSAIAMPALAFPVGSHEGAPMGVQIAAHTWREDLILAAGDALEQRLGEVAPVDVAW